MLEEIEWTIDEEPINVESYVLRDKMYLSVPINKEQTMALNLTITRPTINRILRRIYRFYDSSIDSTLKERMGLVGEKWRDVMEKKKIFGGINHVSFDIFELKLFYKLFI